MYALYKKIPRGYSVEVEVIAVSTNKQILMNMLPHEVKKYLQSGNSRLEDWEIFKYFLPNGYKPLDYWARGAFDATKFEVVETKFI